MTTAQFIKKQQERLKDLIKNNKPLLIAATSTMALQSNRIWIKGLKADLTNIGEYKGGEIYVSVKDSPKKFTPKGKPSSAKKIKNRKTGYFPSYLSYKEAIGRNQNVKSVDLLLSGELSKDWSNGVVAKAKPTRVNAHKYVVKIKQSNYVKAERYGNVFGISPSEKVAFLKVLKYELKNALE